MNIKHIAAAAFLATFFVLPARLPALDFSFLDQAPIRFLTDRDMQLLDAAVADVLDHAEDGERRSWSGEDSNNSGTVTALSTFDKDGRQCRRIEIVTLASQATKGRGSSKLDLCRIDETWKILRAPQ